MPAFSRAIIMYNPRSTGESRAIAEKFCHDLRKLRPAAQVELQATTHAGHAEELGRELTEQHTGLLLVSVSGDGGYHELVNGIMQAVNAGAPAPICAVLPGGNANDHYSAVAERPLLEAIAADGIVQLDLLQIKAVNTRYAHSYAGLGLTPAVALELNRHQLTVFKEAWLTLQTFWRFKPVKIVENGRQQTLDSLILANTDVMAKYLTLDDDNSPRDGRFEVLEWPHISKLRLIRQLAMSAAGKPQTPKTVTSFGFTTVAPMPMQLDGELIALAANQPVMVTCVPNSLRTYR